MTGEATTVETTTETSPPETTNRPEDRLRTSPQFQDPPPKAGRPRTRRAPNPRPTRSRTRQRQLLEAEREATAAAADRAIPAVGGILPGGTASDAADAEPPSFKDAVRDLAEAGAHGAGKKRDATEADWSDFLVVLVGFASALLIWFLVAGRGWTKVQRREYELTAEEAEALSAPAARIVARSWVNARYGKHVLGAADYLVMALVFMEYAERIAPLAQDRVARARQAAASNRSTERPRGQRAPSGPSPAGTEEGNGVVARPAEAGEWQPVVYPSQLT